VLGHSTANDDQWLLCSLELGRERALAGHEVSQRLRICADVVVFVGGLDWLADEANLKTGVEPALADARVEDGRFVSGVGANKEDDVGLLDARDGGVEEVVGADVNAVDSRLVAPRLVESKVVRAETIDKILEGNKGLCIGEVASNSLNLVALGPGGSKTVGDGLQSLLPGRRDETVTLLHKRGGQSLELETVVRVTGLVADPLLVDIVVGLGLDAHHLDAAGVDADVGAEGIKNVNRLRVLQLPRTSMVCVGLACEGTDGAKVDDVARQLRVHGLLHVGSNLHVVATASSAELLDTSNFVGETNATRALNTPVHGRLDEGPEVLVLDCTLASDFVETSTVGTISHGLVLQVTLSSLITNGAVKRVVGEQEFHDTLARFVNEGRICPDLGTRHRRHGTTGGQKRQGEIGKVCAP